MNNNNKKRIFIAIIFIILLFLLMTFAGGNSEVAIVEFIDGFDNSTISTQEVEIGEDAEVPEDPYHKNYVFAGWYLFEDHDIKVKDFTNIEEDLKVIALYAGDRNNNGKADEDEETFTVKFVDGVTEDVIKTEDVLVGMDATAPEAPAHRGYTFVGWDKGYTNIQANTTVTAEYRREVVEATMYTVTFVDGDTQEVITTQRVEEGNAATLPEAPKHENRVFKEWTGNYTNVTSNRTITAIYTDDKNNDGIDDETQPHYDVTYYDYNDEVIEVIEDVLVDMPTPTIANPEREHYTFEGWEPELAETVTDNTDYKATYAPINDENGNNIADEEEEHFTITYVDYNNEPIKVFEDVLVGLETPTIDNPTREYYTFAGWNPTVAEKVTADAEYKATYTINNDVDGDQVPDELEEKWTVTYKITDKEVYKTFENLVDGIATPKVDNPTRNYYTFNGWNPAVKATVEANDVYVAEWKANNDQNNDGIADEEQEKFTVVYNDYDGKELYTEKVLINMPTPSIPNPTRQYYTFAGWTPTVAPTVTADATYTATYTINNDVDGDKVPDELEEKWTVTYKITEDEVYKTIENLVDGIATPKVDNPTRNYYTFNGWNPAVKATVEANDVYVAKWIANTDENGNNIADEEEAHYDITYVDHENNVIKKFEDVLVGLETPTIDNPTRQYYTFAGWTPAVAEKVTAEETYKATWTADEDKNDDNIADQEQDLVVVKFYGKDNTTVISTQWIIRGEDATAPTPQTVKGFAFVKWLQTYTNVTVDELNVYAEYKDVEAPVVESNVTLYNQKDGEYYNANIKFTVTDNVGVSEVRYAKGNLDENDYSNAEQISKYEINGISQNGIYTIFAKDEAGNISVHHVEVSGISLTEGTFEDLFAEYELGKRTNGWIDGNDKYSQKVTITPFEGKTIVDARIYKDTGFLGFAPSYANLSDFTSNVDANGKSTFGSALDYSGNKIEYTLESAVTSRFTIYVKYAYQVETAPGVYETRYETKLYKVRLAKYLAQ